MESLQEHMKQFSAVSLSAESTANALEQTLRKYGPVNKVQFSSFIEALHYVFPLKSFTTRFLVLGMNGWSVIMTDSKESNCYVQAYAISRATNCNAIGVVLQDQRRELQVFEQGKKVRQVQSLLDVDAWYYREEGTLQPWEEPNEYTRRPKRNRLNVTALERYFETYTGFKIPSWNTAYFAKLIGLERSVHEAQVPIIHFDTAWDL
jgi:hypothetical protein